MIERKKYLEALIRRQWNHRIKVITGIRRCGKSTLLFELFREYLLSSGEWLSSYDRDTIDIPLLFLIVLFTN